ncbi:hypothetical protein BJ165DRAFT_1572778 [Panaeolus papilionaceus]|nr:hypothetical protein BJ165DRAFT_1572778 [Panaeolus papilionaceus]
MALVESVQFAGTGNGLNVKTQPFNSISLAKGANGSSELSAASAVSATGSISLSSSASTAVESESKSEFHSSTKSLMTISELSKDNTALATAQSQAFASFLSQAAWMRFSIVAQPDVTAIAKDARFKEFVGRISSLTIQTVSSQIRSELSIAVNRIVDELTANLELRVAAVQSVILDEVLASSVSTTATSDGSLSGGLFDSLMTSLNKITPTDITKTINKTNGGTATDIKAGVKQTGSAHSVGNGVAVGQGNGVAAHAGNGVVGNGAAVENGTVGGKAAVAVTGQIVTSGNGVAVSGNITNTYGQATATKAANELALVTGGATQTTQNSTQSTQSSTTSSNSATETSQWSTNQASNNAVSGGTQITFDAGSVRGQQFVVDNHNGGGWATGTDVAVSGNGFQVTSAQQGNLGPGEVGIHASSVSVEQHQNGGQWNASNGSSTTTNGGQSLVTSPPFIQSSGGQVGNARFTADQHTGGGWAPN